MTRDEQTRLRKMLPSRYGVRFHTKAEKIRPYTSAEKSALKLVRKANQTRNQIAARLDKQYRKLCEAAHRAVFFGDDTKRALAAIDKANAFKR